VLTGSKVEDAGLCGTPSAPSPEGPGAGDSADDAAKFEDSRYGVHVPPPELNPPTYFCPRQASYGPQSVLYWQPRGPDTAVDEAGLGEGDSADDAAGFEESRYGVHVPPPRLILAKYSCPRQASFGPQSLSKKQPGGPDTAVDEAEAKDDEVSACELAIVDDGDEVKSQIYPARGSFEFEEMH
jgi:hypothetical protein